MSKLPKLKINEPKQWQKERLQNWLTYWYKQKELDLISCDDDYSPDGTITDEQISKLKELVNPFDSNVQKGEIRLLPSSLVPDSHRPYYIAVIKEWEDDLMLIAPYAPFSEPATRGELDTLLEHVTLANLELWNARIVPNIFLRQSWLVDEMSDLECEEAFAVFAHITSGKILPEDLVSRIGLPIIHPNDPRIEYQNSEKELLTPLSEKVMRYESFSLSLHTPEKTISFVNFAERHIDLPMAASSNDIEESKCIIMTKTISDLVIDEFESIYDGDVEKCFTATSLGFEPLNIKYMDVEVLDWELPKNSELDGSEFVFAIDKINNSLIGTGRIDIDEGDKFVKITNINYDIITRDIDKSTDIVLVIIKI